MSIRSSLTTFMRDREYFRLLVKYALPIALQSLVMSSLNMAAVLMIGQLGEASIAAVGLANQIWFLLNLVVFGVVSGASMFVAQLWGKGDISNIRRVLGLTVKLGLLAALFFWALAIFFPENTLMIYTRDPAVIEVGSGYLRLFCWSFPFFSVTAAYGVTLRSTGNVRLPLVISTASLGISILLAYPLIFGVEAIGLEPMGVRGAAVSGVVARILECGAMMFAVYRNRAGPAAATLHDLVEIDLKFISRVMKPVLPVIINEVLWSLGITSYNAIYGHMGTDSVAAINIVTTIDQLAFVIFMGLGTATAIMVGNLIGEGQVIKAYAYAGRSLFLQMTGGAIMGAVVYLFAGNIFQLYKVSPVVIENASAILAIMALGMWVRAANHVIIIGILRSGGDTRFSLILDGLVIWFVGVPVTAAGAFLFNLPIHLVYALTFCEEITKMVAGLWRYFSKKWINDLTQHVSV